MTKRIEPIATKLCSPNLSPIQRRVPIYVAGAYSGKGILDSLDNMRIGQHICYDLVKKGPIAPWCPWMDYHYSLIGPMTMEEYLSIGLAWVSRALGMFVLPGSGVSKGTSKEIAEAVRCIVKVIIADEDELFEHVEAVLARTKR